MKPFTIDDSGTPYAATSPHAPDNQRPASTVGVRIWFDDQDKRASEQGFSAGRRSVPGAARFISWIRRKFAVETGKITVRCPLCGRPAQKMNLSSPKMGVFSATKPGQGTESVGLQYRALNTESETANTPPLGGGKEA